MAGREVSLGRNGSDRGRLFGTDLHHISCSGRDLPAPHERRPVPVRKLGLIQRLAAGRSRVLQLPQPTDRGPRRHLPGRHSIRSRQRFKGRRGVVLAPGVLREAFPRREADPALRRPSREASLIRATSSNAARTASFSETSTEGNEEALQRRWFQHTYNNTTTGGKSWT